ncbi:MAG: Crp/Fnr family transcriptional regulator [Saprospiraceae bacterium]|nr:Crp/Fnr family transcriptional regulator [Saprospiraceae bacterium]MCB9308802.1 Crp/Fnr family transcriptional regulator [Lewinellaceae bacterium]
MTIDPDILLAWGAITKKYNKHDFIFYEGDQCRFYHQILDGTVKMCSYNEEGKLFILGMFEKGDSFGEPPLFINKAYPACAQAEEDCIIYKLSKDTLFKLLNEYPNLKMELIQTLSSRIYEKSIVNKNIINPHPEDRILGFLKKYKIDHRLPETRVHINVTRQHIANHLGLRVETIIRTLKKMETTGQVIIDNRKLYF